jgi:hypothetical protein
MRLRHLGFSIFAVVVALSGCSACTNNVGAVKLAKLQGRVTAGTPLTDAVISAFAVGDDGKLGEALEIEATTTDATGAFSASFSAGAFTQGQLVVCATGGSFVEPATSTVVRPTDPWCSHVDVKSLGSTTEVLISPWTTLHRALTSCMVSRGDNVDEAPTTAAALFNGFLGVEGQVPGFDLRTGSPLDVTLTVATGVDADAWQGVLLAALSETAKQFAVASNLEPGLRVNTASLLASLVADVDDGALCQFDGQGRSGRLSVGEVALTADTLRGAPQGLATSTLRFLEGQRNASTIPAGDVADLVNVLAAHGVVDGRHRC